MFYRIGLDVGIGSVGYAVLENDSKTGEPIRIERVGVRTFNPNEVAKTGESTAKDRREKRGIRRRKRRREFRMQRVRNLIKRTLGEDAVTNLQKLNNEDIYKLRYNALDNLVKDEEVAKIILNILKRRGFKSSRLSPSKEDGVLVKAISDNENKLRKNGYRTVGEMIFKDSSFKTEICGHITYNVRNHYKDYRNSFSRNLLKDELNTILKTQQQLGNKKITDEFIERVIYIFEKQRNFDEGPGVQSPYHKESFEVGNCTFIPSEKRAPKASYTFEYFTALSKINNLKCDDEPLTQSQKEQLYNELKTRSEITYKQVRSLFNVDADKLFNLCNYRVKKKEHKTEEEVKEQAEKTVFVSMKNSYAIRKSLNVLNDEKTDIELIDNIALMLSLCKSNEKIDNFIEEYKLNLNEEQINNIKQLNFDKFGSLSFVAMKKITPFLLQGERYDKACKLAGFDDESFEHPKTKYLKGESVTEALKDVTNNVVKRAVNQTIRIVNEIIKEYGSPQYISIELARDIAKNPKERKDIKTMQDNNAATNQELYEKIQKEHNITKPSGQDILKYKLYIEQEAKCMYSGKTIDINRLFEPNYTQIDHILPISRSMNDSYNNKVLVLSYENQNKGNRTPYEFFGNDEKKWHEFVMRVSLLKNTEKQKLLLKKNFSEEESKDFISRNLNDTRYISKLLLNLFQKNLQMADYSNKDKNRKTVRSINGVITSYLRKCWGINKLRDDGDIHHAIDATIIACASDSQVQKITKFNKFKEIFKNKDDVFVNCETGEQMTLQEKQEYEAQNLNLLARILPLPYETFLKELKIRTKSCYENFYFTEEEKDELQKIGYTQEQISKIKPIFVSKMKNVKTTGAIHEETIMSAREYEETGYLIKSKKVQEIKLVDVREKIALKDDKYPDCSIESYYRPQDDRLLYLRLKNYLKEEGKIPNTVYKPRKDGTDGPKVNTVKVYEKCQNIVKTSNGAAKNDTMFRVDVFEKDKQYYLCPVYMADVYAKKLPNKLIAINKPWITIDNSFKFKFSLYKNDLVKITSAKSISLKKNIKNDKSLKADVITNNEFLLYYNSTGISVASIKLNTHDNCYGVDSCGVKNLLSIEKYYVDIMGNIYKANKEERKPL